MEKRAGREGGLERVGEMESSAGRHQAASTRSKRTFSSPGVSGPVTH